MARKGLSIWLFSSLTFVSLLHLLDAIAAAVFGNPIKILQLYPFIGEILQVITPQAYLWISSAATCVLWGVTCAIAFENPVEKFLDSILSEAKMQGKAENQLLETKSEVLDAMFETIESSSETLAQVKDLVYNVRTDAKEIKPLRESMERIQSEITNLKREVKKIEEKAKFRYVCPACGKPILPEFEMCPYCGENTKIEKTPVIAFDVIK